METDTTPTTKVEREMTLSREQMQEKSMDALQLINRKILCRVRGILSVWIFDLTLRKQANLMDKCRSLRWEGRHISNVDDIHIRYIYKQCVFKELSDALEQKDSLLWELQYRFITIEQLLKNREKLKMMQPGTPCPRAESEKGGDLGM